MAKLTTNYQRATGLLSSQPALPILASKSAVGQIVAGDCRQYLPKTKPQSINLVLTDPPYFIDGMGQDWDHNKLRQRSKPGVVGGLPAGQKFDSKQGPNLQSFLTPIAKACQRALKPGGFMLCFSQPRLVHHAALALELAGFEIRDVLAWAYEGQAKAFSQDHFVKRMDIAESQKATILRKLNGRKTPQLKPQMELIVLGQKPKQGTFVDNWLTHQAGLIDVQNPVIQPGKFPGTIIPHRKPKRACNHLTTKPVDLCRHLIRIFSAKGGLVLDPFAGSGTTGLAALIEDRNFIGYEVDQEMAQAAQTRLDDCP